MNKSIPMKSRNLPLSFAVCFLAASLIGQTAPAAPAPQLPDSPSQTQAPATGGSRTPATTTPPAQPGGAAKSDSDESVTTLKATVNEVRVVFTVTDRHGRYIKDLKSDDFKIIDDQKLVELRSFRSETDLPLQVGLLVDASNSVRDRFKFEQDAAIEFLNSIIRPHYDEAFVSPRISPIAPRTCRRECVCCARAAVRRCMTLSTLPAGTSY